MKNGSWEAVLLAAGLYINACLATIALVHLPPAQLPWYCLPPPPPIIEERNPYQDDCLFDSEDYCWMEGYII